MAARQVTARFDDRLSARIVRRTPLYYEEGDDPDEGRPAFVRAGSSMSRFREYVAVIQDDANFIALIDSVHGRARCIALPRGPSGHRVFDDHPETGDHENKLDLEACMTLPDGEDEVLVALGSGSSRSREWIVRLSWPRGGRPDVRMAGYPDLYSALRARQDFCAGALNLEGSEYLGHDLIRLFQRGNKQPSDGRRPIDATADVRWSKLRAHLDDPEEVPPPELLDVVQYELGELNGIRLTFSDAEKVGEALLYSASAEASDETDEVAGSVLGIIDADGTRWSRLIDEHGAVFSGKAEGLSVDAQNSRRVLFVVDEDDATRPSELFEAELEGPWF